MATIWADEYSCPVAWLSLDKNDNDLKRLLSHLVAAVQAAPAPAAGRWPRVHACSSDPAAISGYLGSGQTFDAAITEFAEKYADENERDYAAFTEAIRSGRVEAHVD